MKKFIFTMIVSVFACMSINAEEVMNNKADESVSTQIEALPEVEAQPVDNGLMLQYPNLYTETSQVNATQYKAANYDDQGYRNVKKWKNGRTLRTVGMVTTGVGVIASVALLSDFNKKEDDAGKTLAKVFLGPAAIGAGILATTAGVIMWASGNHKMRSARLSYTGNGLSYNF